MNSSNSFEIKLPGQSRTGSNGNSKSLADQTVPSMKDSVGTINK